MLEEAMVLQNSFYKEGVGVAHYDQVTASCRQINNCLCACHFWVPCRMLGLKIPIASYTWLQLLGQWLGTSEALKN